MILLYRFITTILAIIIYPWARLKAARGRDKWRGRLGLPGAFVPSDLWLHAASVGEVRIIQYLIDALQAQRPSLRIQVTVTTDQGYRTAGELLESAQVHVSFLPADADWFVRRALRTVTPRFLVIAETEIWPNLILGAGARGIPIILINGRMTEKGARRYRLISLTMRQLLSHYRRFFFRTEADQARFLALGADPQRCEVVGDMKFDAPLNETAPSERQQTRGQLGVDAAACLLVCGSTRPGEEEILLDSIAELSRHGLRWQIVIAPRHLDRVPSLEALVRHKGHVPIRYSTISDTASPASSGMVVLVDQMGLLHRLYGAADAAFVGGTLVPIGGHNLLEPVWCGVPVLFGSHLDNVREAAEYILTHRFGARVDDAAALSNTLAGMAKGSIRFAKRDSHVVAESATARIAAYLERQLADV